MALKLDFSNLNFANHIQPYLIKSFQLSNFNLSTESLYFLIKQNLSSVSAENERLSFYSKNAAIAIFV